MGGLRAPLTFALIAGPEADPALGLVAATSQPLAALGERALPPDLPPQAARQIAVALADVSRDPGGAVEVALDPPELGRVRLSLVEVNGAMTLSIIAERPETADLMRRHLALLAEEFARQGLDAPSVDISGGGQGGQGARDAQGWQPLAWQAVAAPKGSP
jgi:flagellar hook-length control protein FliK